MEDLKFQRTTDEQGMITGLVLGGRLVLEHAQQFKKELVACVERLGESITISIEEGTEIDLSGLQLIVAFIKQIDDRAIGYQLIWNLDEEQRLLFENVGLSNELFMNP